MKELKPRLVTKRRIKMSTGRRDGMTWLGGDGMEREEMMELDLSRSLAGLGNLLSLRFRLVSRRIEQPTHPQTQSGLRQGLVVVGS